MYIPIHYQSILSYQFSIYLPLSRVPLLDRNICNNLGKSRSTQALTHTLLGSCPNRIEGKSISYWRRDRVARTIEIATSFDQNNAINNETVGKWLQRLAANRLLKWCWIIHSLQISISLILLTILRLDCLKIGAKSRNRIFRIPFLVVLP